MICLVSLARAITQTIDSASACQAQQKLAESLSEAGSRAIQAYNGHSPSTGPAANGARNPQLEAWQEKKRLQKQIDALKAKLQVALSIPTIRTSDVSLKWTSMPC